MYVRYYLNILGVKCTDLQEHTIVEFAGDVFDEWIISKWFHVNSDCAKVRF